VAAAARLTKANPRTSLITREGVTVTKPQDLIGLKIAVPGLNSGFDLNLRKWLLDGNVPLDKVTIVEAPFPQMGDRLKGGQLDAAIQIEPLLSHNLQSGAAKKSVDILSVNNPDQLGVFYLAKRDWAMANRKRSRIPSEPRRGHYLHRAETGGSQSDRAQISAHGRG